MRKRVRCVPEGGGLTRETSGPPPENRHPVRWLNLGSLPKDMRKLVYSLLSPDDMYMVRSAHGLTSPPTGPTKAGKRYRIPPGFHERCAQRGHWDILKYTIVNHDPSTLSITVFQALIATGQLPLIQWFLCMAHHHYTVNSIGGLAVIHGHLSVLQWAVELGYELDSTACWQAVRNGDMAMLEWLFVTKQCPWQAAYVCAALQCGNMHVIEWFDKRGFDYSTHYVRDAAGELQPVRVPLSESDSDDE